MLDNTLLFTVTDLKQYTYCPRVVFYEQCLPHIRPRTYKMDAGRDAHEAEQKRAARRTLHAYSIPDGERRFDLPLTDPDLGLSGIVDEVVFTAAGEIFPVDYKLAKKVGSNHRIQLTAYALLLEAAYTTTVQRGFIYLMPVQQMAAVVITPALREKTTGLLREMRLMVEREQMPLPTDQPARCADCEFRRFCNDV